MYTADPVLSLLQISTVYRLRLIFSSQKKCLYNGKHNKTATQPKQQISEPFTNPRPKKSAPPPPPASNGQVWTRHLAPAAPAFHCLLSSLRVRLAIRMFAGSQFSYPSLPGSGRSSGPGGSRLYRPHQAPGGPKCWNWGPTHPPISVPKHLWGGGVFCALSNSLHGTLGTVSR